MKFLLVLVLSIRCLQAEGNSGTEMLLKASREGDLATVQRLLDSGVNPNLLDERGLSPLYYAVSCKSVDVLQLLLAHHADPNARLGWQAPDLPVTPLQNAAYLDNLRAASLLVTAGTAPLF
jgi:ankyrin repeat protein